MIDIKFSPAFPCRLLIFLSLMFLIASLLLYLSQPWLLPLMLLLFSISVYKLITSNGHGLRLVRNPEGDWSMQIHDNDWESVELQGNSLLWSQLMVLHFRMPDGRSTSLLLDRCTLPDQQWRQLQVSLRIKGLQSEFN